MEGRTLPQQSQGGQESTLCVHTIYRNIQR
nr:MAG TPA: hypothetical protein [Caudoviricetes sp.]